VFDFEAKKPKPDFGSAFYNICLFLPAKHAALFSFLIKKPFLQDLVPDGHIDIHSHLLPGIDDGAKALEDTVSLMSGLAKIGCSQFITTPHVMKSVWENTRHDIQEKLAETTGLLKNRGIDMPLHAAAEYLLDNNFSELFKSEPLLTLKGNYVLVEMSYINPPIQLYEILFELQVAGYIPVLAHPERYSFYHQNFNHYQKLKDAGCLFQLNLLSVVGYYGQGVYKTAERLLRRGMIDFTGSDVHHQKHLNSFSKRIFLKDAAPLVQAMSNNKLFGI
jgi:tyrosine-protein phosphatase YwqE